MYELFEHTADLGLRVVAPDLETLFRDGARGLFAVIAGELPSGVSGEKRDFSIPGDRRDYLFFDWLNELLFVYETEHLLLGDFELRLTDEGLTARATACPVHEAASGPLREVKAITYHQLRVEPTEQGWIAEVIVDI